MHSGRRPPLEELLFYRTGHSSGDAFELFVMESLILAQNERWRHGLGMQVERTPFGEKVAKG